MAQIFIDYYDELQPLILEVINEFKKDKHTTYVADVTLDYTLKKDDFEALLDADYIVFFLEKSLFEDVEYIKRIKNLISTSELSDKIKKTIAIVFPEDFEIKDFERKLTDLNHDRNIALSALWEEQPYVEAYKIVQAINGYSNPAHINIQEKKEIKHNIEQNAPEFINTAIKALEKRGKKLDITGTVYFITGSVSIIICIVYTCATFSQTLDYLAFWDSWKISIYVIIKGIVLIGLFVALAKYAFILGKAYMHESLKVKERIHAIAFGQFYLNVYKEGVTPSDLKEVFRDWNISNQTSAFSINEGSDFDPKYIENIVKLIDKSKDVVKTIGEVSKTAKGD